MAEAFAQTQVERLGNIALLLGTQCAQTSIEKIAGDPKKFQGWIKNIDKYKDKERLPMLLPPLIV